jgi:hypothetical protein
VNHPRLLPPVVVTTLVTLLLALHWWLGVSATREMSTTSDELAHVTGGFAYWRFNDYRLQPENGNLPQRLAALPWVAAGARMDTTDAAWTGSDVWLIGHRFFFGSGNNTDYLMLLTHATMATLGAGLGLLIFAWSRRLWGESGGLCSLGLYALCPNFLAHGPLATSDVAMTLVLLAASGAFWRQARRLDPSSWALSAGLLAVASVTKFSWVLLLPVGALMIAVRLVSTEPLTLAFGPARAVTTWRGKLAVLVPAALAQGLVAWVAIWVCFGGRFSAAGPGLPAQAEFYVPWAQVMPAHGFWQVFFSWARGWRLLPDAYLQGFAFVLFAAAERGAFLNGEYSNTGWPAFFPYAFLVKTPLPQLAAFALAGGAALAAWGRASWMHAWADRVRHDLYRVAPLAILFAVYWAFSVTSHLNIGHRHILPTYPALFIVAGLLVRPGVSRWLAAAAAALLVWNAAESTHIRPHYLAYFNPIAGGPEDGWRHLVDSSLDWGQDLPGLAAWLRREARPHEKVYVSYFGTGDFEYEGIRARELAPVYNFDKPRHWFELEPGLYCLGATALQDVYSGWRGPWTLAKELQYRLLQAEITAPPPALTAAEYQQRFQKFFNLDRLRFARLCHYLRLRRPDAVVGYSIFIYRLDAEETRIVAHGSMAELAALMDRALQARGE